MTGVQTCALPIYYEKAAECEKVNHAFDSCPNWPGRTTTVPPSTPATGPPTTVAPSTSTATTTSTTSTTVPVSVSAPSTATSASLPATRPSTTDRRSAAPTPVESTAEPEPAIPVPVGTPAAPVLVAGTVPRATPDSPVVIQTDPETVVDYLALNERVLQFQDDLGFRLSVSALDASGAMSPITPDGALLLSRADSITVTGAGFRPRSDAVVWMFSTPRLLGTVRVRTDGALSARLAIAPDVPLGAHTVQVNGVTERGAVRSLNLAVVVVDAIAEAPTVASLPMVPTPEPGIDRGLAPSLVAVLVASAFVLGAAIAWGGGRLRRHRS